MTLRRIKQYIIQAQKMKKLFEDPDFDEKPNPVPIHKWKFEEDDANNK